MSKLSDKKDRMKVKSKKSKKSEVSDAKKPSKLKKKLLEKKVSKKSDVDSKEYSKKSKEKKIVEPATEDVVKVSSKGLKKYGKSITKLGNAKALTEKLMTQVSVSGFHTQGISCEIVSRDKFGIVVRYKRSKGRGVKRESFSYDQILAIHRLGDKHVITVNSNRILVEAKGSVTRNEAGWFVCTNLLGETIEINPHSRCNVDVNITSAEDEDFVGGGKQKNSKRSPVDPDDDELDDDSDDV